MSPKKRIITWRWGNNPTQDEHTATRGFIFGGYNASAPAYTRLVEEARRDFPSLRDKDIELSKVTQSTYMKGFIVVSFPLPPNTEKRGYDNWQRFDFHY